MKKNLLKKYWKIICIVVIIGAIAAGIEAYNTPANRLRRQLDLGYKYLEEHQYEEACIIFEQAILIDDKCIKAYAGGLEAYIEGGNDERTQEFYDRALEVIQGLDEDLVDQNLDSIVEIYLASDKVYGSGTDRVVEILEEGVQVTFESSKVKKSLADNYFIMADLRISKEEYEESLELLDKASRLGGKESGNEEIEKKKKEIQELIEERKLAEEEKLRKEKEEREEKEKQREQTATEKDIHEWMVRNLGLIEKYPVLLGYSKSKPNIFYLMYGYEVDNYEHTYVFSIEGNTWTISEHSIWDGKIGEGELSSVNVGKTYDMTITDEVRTEFENYQENQTIFQAYANKFNDYLSKENYDLTMEFELDDIQFEKMSNEGELEGTIVYWENKNSSFVDQIIMKASVNPELNQITIMEAKMNAYIEPEIDYESYKGTYKLE